MTSLKEYNRSFLCAKNPYLSKRRLFCFSHAGGAASLYKNWLDSMLSEEVDIYALQLPGRENRFLETPFEDLTMAIQKILEEIKPLLDRPFYFFGHSMGAIFAFELAQLLALNNIHPDILFVSSCEAPHRLESKSIHLMSDKDLKEYLHVLGGMHSELIENEDLIEFLLPAIRTDFKMIENYSHSDYAFQIKKIVTFLGEADTVSSADLLEWQKYSSYPIRHKIFSGNHFYLKDPSSEKKLIETIRYIIANNE